jgi:hypothetical protein
MAMKQAAVARVVDGKSIAEVARDLNCWAGFCVRAGTRFVRVGRQSCAGGGDRASGNGSGGPGIDRSRRGSLQEGHGYGRSCTR